MKEILLHPCYFGPITQFVAMIKTDKIRFENEDNFQKQTYRNRMYIYSANGRLALSIPIRHTGNKTQHQKFKEVQIENDFPWQQQHWRSLETCYRTSPFFEFYEDEFQGLYSRKFKYLLDFNYACLEVLHTVLEWDLDYLKTTKFEKEAPGDLVDGRHLVDAKAIKDFGLSPYTQVFQQKEGFLENLSILDLLFNEGPGTEAYLESQPMDLILP